MAFQSATFGKLAIERENAVKAVQHIMVVLPLSLKSKKIKLRID
jgi:hypothetical protein